MACRQDHCGQQRGRQAIYFGHVKALGLQGIGRWQKILLPVDARISLDDGVIPFLTALIPHQQAKYQGLSLG
jgi:hypothetical protein